MKYDCQWNQIHMQLLMQLIKAVISFFFFLLCDLPAVAQSSAYSDKLGPSSAAGGHTAPLL